MNIRRMALTIRAIPEINLRKSVYSQPSLNSGFHNRRIDTFIGIYIRVCVFLVTKVHGYGCLQIEELPAEIVKAVLEFAVIPREQ